MELPHITFRGTDIDDPGILACLPSALRSLLTQINGFIQFHGGLHVRGACQQPLWHSLQEVWTGRLGLYLAYPGVTRDDVPFAQDCLGDQFLLRNGKVVRLYAETGEMEALELDLFGFLSAATSDPIDFLGLQPLMRFETEGGRLEPGQLLAAYPPFCTRESASGVSLRAVPTMERLSFLADFCRQVGQFPEGQQFRVRIEP